MNDMEYYIILSNFDKLLKAKIINETEYSKAISLLNNKYKVIADIDKIKRQEK